MKISKNVALDGSEIVDVGFEFIKSLLISIEYHRFLKSDRMLSGVSGISFLNLSIAFHYKICSQIYKILVTLRFRMKSNFDILYENISKN